MIYRLCLGKILFHTLKEKCNHPNFFREMNFKNKF